VQFVTPTIN